MVGGAPQQRRASRPRETLDQNTSFTSRTITMIATASSTSWTRSPRSFPRRLAPCSSRRGTTARCRAAPAPGSAARGSRPSSRPRARLRLQRRKLARAAVDRQLVDVLVLDVLQVRLAEVVDADAFGQLVAEQRARRLRDEDLAAVAGRADPRRAHDVEPDVALVADRRLAGVQAHPHADVLRPAATRRRAARAVRRRPPRPPTGRARRRRRRRRPACPSPCRRARRTSRG